MATRRVMWAAVAMVAAGCAQGGVKEPGVDWQSDGDPSSAEDAGGIVAEDGAPDDEGEDAGTAELPDMPDAGAMDGDAGDGDGGAPDDPDPDPDPEAACAAPNTCGLATDLGSLSGDTNGSGLNATGHTSGFYIVHVTEDDSTPLVPRDLRVTATLSSPTTDFDLYLYAEGNGCGTLSDSSDGTGADKVNASWSDDQGFGGVDSGRLIVLEVRHKSGVCDASNGWTLAIGGNQ